MIHQKDFSSKYFPIDKEKLLFTGSNFFLAGTKIQSRGSPCTAEDEIYLITLTKERQWNFEYSFVFSKDEFKGVNLRTVQAYKLRGQSYLPEFLCRYKK